MGSEWPRILLEDGPLRIFDGDRGKNYPKRTEFKSSGHCVFLNTGNVTQRGFDFSSTDFVSEEKDDLLGKGKLQREDVVLTTRGTVGNSAYYAAEIPHDHVRINSGMVILRSNVDILFPRFLYFFVRSQTFSEQVSALQSGSAQPQLPIRDLRRFEIPLPPLPEQKAIAHILGTLDDKIELNRRMNATLEAMAQALFKSWFVDFDPVIDNALAAGNPIPDELAERAEVRRQAIANGTANREAAKAFPDSFQETEELSWIPRAWEAQEFGKLAQNIREGVDPTTLPSETPYVGLEHIDKQSFCLSRWGVATDVDSQKSHYKPEDFLFGKLRPYFHKVCHVNSEGICSTDILVIRPRHEDDAGYVGCQIFEPEFVEYANLRSTGTRMPRASWKDMAKYEIACPPQILRQAFNIQVKPIREKCAKAVAESINLTKLRSTLLPKLISGELRVSEAKQLTEEAIK